MIGLGHVVQLVIDDWRSRRDGDFLEGAIGLGHPVRPRGISQQQTAVRRALEHRVAAFVVADLVGDCHEDGVVAMAFGGLALAPLPQQHHAGLRVIARLEEVAVHIHHGQQLACPKDALAEVGQARIVQQPVGQHDCHATAGLEELQAALDKQDFGRLA